MRIKPHDLAQQGDVTAGPMRGHQRGKGAVWKSTLSPACCWLIEATQGLGFGRIKHLIIVNAEPIIEPPPKVYRRKGLTQPNHQREKVHLEDFILKEPVGDAS